MRRIYRMGIQQLGYAAAVVGVLSGSSAVAQTTVEFQNGLNGYTGTFDMRISTTAARDGFLGAAPSTNLLIDGYAPQNPDGTGGSPDEQMLVRFDNMFGGGAGQIPLGATILSATLQYTTSDSGTADSPGPWGVAALNQPFTSATRYPDFPGGGPIGYRGAWWEDGYATRPQGGFDGTDSNDVETADVRAIVQLWSSDPEGDNNHGFVMQAGWPGQTNGWNFWTTGIGSVPLRPKLTVTYTTDPVEVNTFQRDLNGYTGDTMVRIASGDIQTSSVANPDETVDDITYDGYTGVRTVSPTYTPPAPPAEDPPNPLTDFQIFLDGPTFTATPGVLNSNDQLAILKFDNVFGASAGQSPLDKEVAKAWLVLTTGNTNNNARSNGTWAAFPMLHDWDTTTLYSDLGATPGLQATEDIGAEISDAHGMIAGSEVWFDVTSYLEGVRGGATDYGIAVQSDGTSDGWQIHLNGSPDAAFRPRLVVVSDLSASVGLAGDHDGDGDVDAADYVVWRKTDVNGAQGYSDWVENFGASQGGGSQGGAVPEPGAGVMAMFALVAMGAASRKRYEAKNGG